MFDGLVLYCIKIERKLVLKCILVIQVLVICLRY